MSVCSDFKITESIKDNTQEIEIIAGGTPVFSDYIVFGAFQWAR